MSSNNELIVAVGTTNPTKLNCVKEALPKLFPQYSSFSVLPAKVPSGVSDQPLTDDETIQGARGRAQGALEMHQSAVFGVGLEGGVQKTGDRWFESCWVVVRDRSGKEGIGCSAKFELSSKIMESLLNGEELAVVIDRLSGEADVRSNQGAMGILTNGVLCRTECMVHGVIFSFSPFISDVKYWK